MIAIILILSGKMKDGKIKYLYNKDCSAPEKNIRTHTEDCYLFKVNTP